MTLTRALHVSPRHTMLSMCVCRGVQSLALAMGETFNDASPRQPITLNVCRDYYASSSFGRSSTSVSSNSIGCQLMRIYMPTRCRDPHLWGKNSFCLRYMRMAFGQRRLRCVDTPRAVLYVALVKSTARMWQRMARLTRQPP